MGLNILNIGPTPPRIGGSCFANIETLIGLSKKGHRVRCISHLTKEDLTQPDYNKTWKNTGVQVYPIELEWLPSATPPTEEYFRKKKELILRELNQLIAAETPDVVMVGHDSFSFYANKEVKELGFPLVQVLHGTPTHGLENNIYPPELTDQFISSLNQATLVIGVSKYLAGIVNKFGINQTTYIHNGTDTETFKPIQNKDEFFLRSLGIKLGEQVIIHASNFKPIKRTEDLVDSAPFVIEKNGNVKYLIVGDGPLRQETEKRAKDLGVYKHFRFVGGIPFEEIQRYFQHSDALVLPSENEGFGRVIREAQACGSIPVASNVGPLSEVINDGEDGFLFRSKDVHDISDKVLEAVTENGKRERMKTNARATAVRYNLDKMVDDYEKALLNPAQFLSERSV